MLALAWLLPNHYRPWPSFHSEMLGFFGATLLALSVLMAPLTKRLRIPLVAVFAFSLAVLPWLQVATGLITFAGEAVTVTFYLCVIAISLVSGYTLHGQARWYEGSMVGMMHALWVAAMLSATVGLMQWLGVADSFELYVLDGDPGGRAMGNIAQSNQLATLLLLGVLAFLFQFERRTFGAVTTWLVVTFLSVGMLMTQSRAGLLSVVILSVFALYKIRSTSLRLRRSAILLWTIAMLMGIWLVPLFAEWLLLGEGSGPRAVTDSSGRLLLWTQMVHGLLESPWVGYGWNQSVRAEMVGAIRYPAEISASFAHNLPLDLLLWNGLPLGILLIGFGAYWLASRIRRIDGIPGVYALACFIPFGVHSMVEYPFAYSYFLIPLAYMAGVIEASLTSQAKPIEVSLHVLRAGLAIWIFVGAYVVHEYFLIEEDFRITRFEGARIGSRPNDYEVPKIRLLNHMAAMLETTRIYAKPGMNPDDLKLLKDVSGSFGYGVIHYRYAMALALNGDSAGAGKQFAIIKGLFGSKYYEMVKIEVAELARGRYPQLRAVKMP